MGIFGVYSLILGDIRRSPNIRCSCAHHVTMVSQLIATFIVRGIINELANFTALFVCTLIA